MIGVKTAMLRECGVYQNAGCVGNFKVEKGDFVYQYSNFFVLYRYIGISLLSQGGMAGFIEFVRAVMCLYCEFRPGSAIEQPVKALGRKFDNQFHCGTHLSIYACYVFGICAPRFVFSKN